MSIYKFQTADHIVAGREVIDNISEHLSLLNLPVKQALLITQPALVDTGAAEKVEQALGAVGITVDRTTDVEPEPTLENIERVFSETVGVKDYDVLIGLGGGSILDTTKLLSVLKTNDTALEHLLGTDLVEKAGTPTILIPTTSGTGAEVTPNAIVTLPEQELKIGVVSRHLLPNLVLIDPTLTTGLPKPITAATGMDAFTHALESYISNKANPISDMFALESIRLITANIVTAYQDGADLDAREKMLIGSMYGGMALTAAGTAAVHAMAYPLGGKYKIAHGVANSMLLPHVTQFNMDAMVDRLASVAEPMGIDAKHLSSEEAAQAVVDKIKELTTVLEIPQDLREYGVEEDSIESMAVAALEVKRLMDNNPKTLDKEDVKSIYRKLLV
ncbi:alcohol dehydrogenase [Terribacillus saccharophilus]|uniref:iron-containing alcohol dehydrogenase n=1 Tax=Terribacillus saccharophilus TaxID=361277 RepID=UPI000BA56AC5|nr:iron-containing alcohol dehydrogenase [Terribacillus saccharophilus]PAF18585.1 alcohol dehydrogenase [Terribacillus saccharophilus]PAF20307.1 alcohol dehydrogenase [Terribacillus saccharophilus]PAF34662.1 alcohol dehydrogenase [Terribacillus saccharophilus]PAF35548.1 alcohol dehydrogenase [Terribacillus saccharophilus]